MKDEDDDMRAEYDFTGGVRGRYAAAMREGYTITIHQEDGRKEIRQISPSENVVVLDPDVREYFPDSKSVNEALRSLIKLVPAKQQ